MDPLELVAAHRPALDRLHTAWQSCLAGCGRVVALTGPVGAGRTRLLDRLARQATARGALHLAAAGDRTGRPLGLFHQLLPPGFPARDRRERRDPRDPRDLVAPLLALSGRTPVLITVDDAQYADPQSLRCLHHFARLARSSRVLLVVSRRDGFAPPRATGDGELPHDERVRLPLLTRAEVGAYLGGLPGAGDGRASATAFHAMTAGNPVLLAALAEDHRSAPATRALPVPGEAFGRALMRCLYRLPALALPVAGAVAVRGRAADPGELGRALGVPAHRIVPVLAALDAAGLMERGDFRHPRVRAHVLAALPPGERAALSRGGAVLPVPRGPVGAPAAVPRLPPGERLPLSEAEWRVARLAADGLTNRQIAARLYITVSTVEQHLTRVYRKLVVSRRIDLPRSLPRPAA